MRTFVSRFALLALMACATAACASRNAAPISGSGASSESEESTGVLTRTGENASEAVSAARETTREGLPSAATAPLEDLNIRRDEIPASLAAIEYVYASYPPPDCVAIVTEVSRLDVALGRDYDVVADEDESLGRRGGEAAGDLVVDTIRGVTTDVIPFRSLVREASGAAALERKRARAYAAGYARRAYLKGLALGQGCSPPAAPLVIVAPKEEPDIDVRDTRDEPATRTWSESATPPS